MSAFYGGGGGGRTRHGMKVFLNVYDLSPANESVLNHIGLGIHHSGVEVDGQEWTFAGGGGVFSDSPKSALGATYSHAVQLGVFEGTSADVRAAIQDLREEFGPDKYHILLRNCNHFADAFSRRLIGVPIPGYVNRCAYLGSFFSCLIPDAALGQAPVNQPGSSFSSSSSSSASGGGAMHRGGGSAQQPAPVFSGGGAKLGGGGGSGGEESKDLLDRRDKVRQAALARFAMQKDGSAGGNSM